MVKLRRSLKGILWLDFWALFTSRNVLDFELFSINSHVARIPKIEPGTMHGAAADRQSRASCEFLHLPRFSNSTFAYY